MPAPRKETLTQEELKKLLHYAPETGVFTWIKLKCGVRKNLIAGTAHEGYISIMTGQVQYKAHRLAWLYMTGKWPKDCIDHINRVPNDNRFVNLREATHRQSTCNNKMYSNNKSGFRGVYRIR